MWLNDVCHISVKMSAVTESPYILFSNFKNNKTNLDTFF